ncbi:ribonucleotide reductase transcriptional regulator crt10 [Diplodia corticola]|uniref:Ribonucleotide reductase transcriptional regulator crt10 n=1 Tax=Diplodia corticola TaxID=236234 RepID=A0A1J9RVI6_9PEZI|nr:ribonucleotide reductase transcriptional regulator crt10 [Diplodia corticola]OJD31860.1 ribonucleotide reductase transcriptional regulator crt10 [Diplodia corticola]
MDRPARPHPFKEFPASPLGVQSGIERFPRKYRATNPPPRLESWRCNLTALSHIYNLYFVASRYKVLVYEPNFPDQKLSAQPSLVLSPTVLVDAAPDVSEHSPLGAGRTINALLVDFLGNDEILLLALHDGRVIGYHVNQIQRAIERRQEPGCVETIDGDDVRPFFSEDVGSSAWGLAVHREARMIAVSCNAHTVTVFALALTKESLPKTRSWLPNRSQQHRIVTQDSGENIPCVALCNTGDDPEGRWILTSDINGFSRIMDLARCHEEAFSGVDMHAHRFCAMTESAGNKQCGCEYLEHGIRYYLHATWGVMWLDRRAFKRTESVSEALGSEGIPLKVERMSSTLNCYDNSNNRQRVHNSSTIYGSPVGRLEDNSDESSDDDVSVAEPLTEVEVARGVELRRAPRNPGGVTRAQIKIPPSPIMRLSVKDIFLIQPRSAKSPERPPVGFFDPLFQYIRQNPFMEQVCMHDRINLYAQIVELGIVVVGSAKGRVAIMSLTQTDEGFTSRRPFYGCRIDWILPFQDQEEEGSRPLAPLVGIATGPVQGMLGRQADYSRRWRLLMMYADNSVLSYELGKAREGRVTVHEFGGLVV